MYPEVRASITKMVNATIRISILWCIAGAVAGIVIAHGFFTHNYVEITVMVSTMVVALYLWAGCLKRLLNELIDANDSADSSSGDSEFDSAPRSNSDENGSEGP